MKSELSATKVIREKYPYLGYSDEHDMVVLFTEPYVGVVLYSCDAAFPIGYRNISWRENTFVRSVSAVTLSND